MALDFFEDEKSKLDLAKVNMGIVINEYNNKLSKLTIEQKNILQLYFCFKVLKALKEMKPKGNYWNNYYRKIDTFEDILRLINNSCFKIPGISYKVELDNYDDLSDALANIKVDVDRLMEEEKTEEGLSLLDLVNNFSEDIKKAYKDGFGNNNAYLYTVISEEGLGKLSYINNRENQYWNMVYDGVYATGDMDEIQKYIARAATGSGMKADNNEIVYSSNPFERIEGNKLILNNPVSIYMSDIENFEPQYHFELDKYDNARFIFGGEWVAPKPKNEKDKMFEGIVPVDNRTISFLPKSFLNNNVKIVDADGNKTDVRESLGDNRIK